jgi:hypothetical protein
MKWAVSNGRVFIIALDLLNKLSKKIWGWICRTALVVNVRGKTGEVSSH